MRREVADLPGRLAEYVRRIGVREDPLLERLRAETAALPEPQMQISPEQGALLAFLVELLGAAGPWRSGRSPATAPSSSPGPLAQRGGSCAATAR